MRQGAGSRSPLASSKARLPPLPREQGVPAHAAGVLRGIATSRNVSAMPLFRPPARRQVTPSEIEAPRSGGWHRELGRQGGTSPCRSTSVSRRSRAGCALRGACKTRRLRPAVICAAWRMFADYSCGANAARATSRFATSLPCARSGARSAAGCALCAIARSQRLHRLAAASEYGRSLCSSQFGIVLTPCGLSLARCSTRTQAGRAARAVASIEVCSAYGEATMPVTDPGERCEGSHGHDRERPLGLVLRDRSHPR